MKQQNNGGVETLLDDLTDDNVDTCVLADHTEKQAIKNLLPELRGVLRHLKGQKRLDVSRLSEMSGADSINAERMLELLTICCSGKCHPDWRLLNVVSTAPVTLEELKKAAKPLESKGKQEASIHQQ